MFVITSAEIRWFIKGRIPPTIFDWFIGLNENYITQPERTDYYLYTPNNDSVGIKLREGRIEIKQRIKQIGNITLGDQVEGVAEKWHKWSYELTEADQILSPELLIKGWKAVKKNRIIVNYGIKENDIVASKGPATYANGCITEITSVLVDNENWWTIGLEAYGEENRQQDNLILISHLILNDKSNIHLTINKSLSYPGWLNQMNK